jgi:hypothetical protein
MPAWQIILIPVSAALAVTAYRMQGRAAAPSHDRHLKHVPGGRAHTRQQETEAITMNANYAMVTALATAQTGSMVADTAPNAPASASFDLVLEAVAGSALGSSGTPYTLTISAIDLTAVTQGWPTQTLYQAFDAANGWELSGDGPDYQCTQTVAIPVPGGPGGPLAGHTLQCVASLVSQGAQIVSITQSDPFVLV